MEFVKNHWGAFVTSEGENIEGGALDDGSVFSLVSLLMIIIPKGSHRHLGL